MIALENVQKRIENHQILKNISLTLQDNEIIGLIGNNGAGKTTLMKIISGILDINGGNITVENINNQKYSNWAHRNTVYQSTDERGRIL